MSVISFTLFHVVQGNMSLQGFTIGNATARSPFIANVSDSSTFTLADCYVADVFGPLFSVFSSSLSIYNTSFIFCGNLESIINVDNGTNVLVS